MCIVRALNGETRSLGIFATFETYGDMLSWMHRKFSLPGVASQYVVEADNAARTHSSAFMYTSNVRLADARSGQAEQFTFVYL